MWDAIWLYLAGVLTGAVLCGWSPRFLDEWYERRKERKEQRKSDRMRRAMEARLRKR